MGVPTKKKPQGTPSPERRGELLATAAEVFAAQGYNATTVRRIADEAGMLAGSLYYHFDSKESMLDEILSTFLGELWEGYDAVLDARLGPRETIEALVTESFREIDRHRAAVAIYQKEARHLAAQPRFQYLVDSQEKFEKAWLGTLERGVAGGRSAPIWTSASPTGSSATPSGSPPPGTGRADSTARRRSPASTSRWSWTASPCVAEPAGGPVPAISTRLQAGRPKGSPENSPLAARRVPPLVGRSCYGDPVAVLVPMNFMCA